jgi:hypothetical protein
MERVLAGLAPANRNCHNLTLGKTVIKHPAYAKPVEAYHDGVWLNDQLDLHSKNACTKRHRKGAIMSIARYDKMNISGFRSGRFAKATRDQ